MDIRDLTNADVVTAELSATDNAVLDAIEADTTTIAGDTTSIDAKIPALGQALAAASVPVILPAATITTLTPPAAITGFGTSAKQDTIIGHVDGIETSLSSIDGKITAVNTGAVVVSSSALPTGASTAAKQPALGTAGTPSVDVLTVQGTASMTALKVDGSAVTQPVSGTFWQATQPVSLTSTTVTGTVAVTQSGTWDEVGINDSGNSITVDYATTGSGTATGALRVELPTNGTGVIATVGAVTAITNALPAGTNAIGKLAANSGVDIGDVDVTSLPALAAGTNTIGAVKSVPSDIDINGSNANHADKYYTNAGAVTDGIIWSPAAGKRWHVLNLTINVSAACTVTIEDDLAAGDNPRLKFELAANSGITIPYNKEHPFSSGEDAADLLITTTAGNVYVQAIGYEV